MKYRTLSIFELISTNNDIICRKKTIKTTNIAINKQTVNITSPPNEIITQLSNYVNKPLC